MEEIDDDGLVSIDVFVPCFETGVHITLAVRFVLFNIWLFLLFEQILGHEVEDCINALLRVMLSIAFKGHIVLAQDSFEEIWSHDIALADPKFTDELGPSLN